MAEERVFNRRGRWLLRSRIGNAEIASGLAVLAALLVMVGWVLSRGEAYNPAERDLAFEVLAQSPVADRLYRRPLIPWQPPGAAGGTAARAALPELGAFPFAVLEGGWALASRPRQFGPKSLYKKINGEAEKFLRQGFQKLHYLRLKAPDGEREISIELYDQGSVAGAVGIFSDHHGGNRKVTRRDGVLFYATGAGAIGYKGSHFFRIAGSDSSPPVQAKAEQLVAAFNALPNSGSAPEAYKILMAVGIAPEAVAFQNQNVFQYDFAGKFWFGTLPDGGRLFIHRAADRSAAKALLGALLREHGQDHETMAWDGAGRLMRHRFLKTFFLAATRGPWLYGVENRPGGEGIQDWMDRTRGALANEQ